jgi:hypothetical protein
VCTHEVRSTLFTALRGSAPWSACHRPERTMSNQLTSRLSSLAPQEMERISLLNHHGGSVPCVNVSKRPSFSFICNPLKIDGQPFGQVIAEWVPLPSTARGTSIAIESFWFSPKSGLLQDRRVKSA